ncbi:hypothetical protein A4S06_05725 [Erysipelotrichaceae bacterium MTC7]|nr:hypothetical protein A4S06_05725 [Erysipelotrichaceae bacterium MTC7]
MAKEIVLNGRNIYYDKHNRAIYYNKRSQTGYIVPSELTSRFQILSFRYAISLIVLIFCQLLFELNIWISILIAVLSCAYMEWHYRKLLSRMTQIKNFNPELATSSTKEAAKLDTGGTLLRFGLYAALSILLVVNVVIENYFETNIIIAVASIAVSLFSAYMAIRYLLTLTKR